MHKRVAVVLAAATVSSLSLFSPAEADHAWGNYHWARTANPFTLALGNNLTTADWQQHLGATSTNWSSWAGTSAVPKVLNTTVVAGQSNKRCAAVRGTVQVCNSKYGNNGWLGLAQIWLSGGHIVQGVAKMNDTYFATRTYNNPNERQHVMCQEVGHTFGLGHTSEDGSSQDTCMDYFSNTGPNATSTLSTKPNAHDFEQLASIYTDLDSTTTVGTGAGTSSRADVADDRASWGKEVARGANGEFSLFERDLGDGERLLTHVRWADDAQADGRGRHAHAE